VNGNGGSDSATESGRGKDGKGKREGGKKGKEEKKGAEMGSLAPAVFFFKFGTLYKNKIRREITAATVL